MNNKEEKLAAGKLKVKQELAKIERERLEFDKAQAASEKRFWKMGAGTRVTILVTMAAMIVTSMVGISNIWVSKIAKDKEIEVSRIQKQFELEKFDAQKKREWDLTLAQFVLTNQRAIFNGTPQEQQVLAKIIPTVFPDEISVTLLERLEKASPPQTRVIWRQARSRLDTPREPSAKETTTIETAAVTPSSKTYSPITTSSLPSNWPGIDSLTKGRPLSSADGGGFTSYLSNLSVSESLSIPVGLSNSSLGLITDALYRPAPTMNSPRLVDLNKILTDSQHSTGLPWFEATTTPMLGVRDEIQNSLRLGAGVETRIATVQTRTSVSGTVIDAETGNPVPNATVELRSPSGYPLINASGVTDAVGSFRIELSLDSSSLVFGQIELRVSSKGFRSTAKELRLLSSLPVSMATISLQRETSP